MIEILKVVDSYRHLGERRLENGVYLVGSAQYIAPNAWLHSIYPGLNLSEIKVLEKMLGRPIPCSYKSFLEGCNGLKLFNTTFCLDGLRTNYGRSLDDVWQPFDIRTPNISERPKNANDNLFFIGGYDWDGSLLYIDTNTQIVHLCHRDDATSLYKWADFNSMIEAELCRLVTLFDNNGREIDPRVSTLPQAGARM